MKYVWEECDIEDTWGRYVVLNTKFPEDGYKGIINMWKLGGDGLNHTLTCMGDGLVLRFKTVEKLLNHLNADGNSFRPLKKKELLLAIEHNWHRHE